MMEMAESIKEYGVLVPALWSGRKRMAAMRWWPGIEGSAQAG